MSILLMNFAAVIFLLSVIAINGDGKAAVVVYSKDSSCLGKELVRAYSGVCTPYYANDDANLDYFRFQCDNVNSEITLLRYSDPDCSRQVNSSKIVQGYRSDRVCQTLHSSFATVENSFLSVQMFCGGISLKNNPKTYQALFQTEKIAFKHFTNYDRTCKLNPSVIELVNHSPVLITLFSHNLFLDCCQFTINDCLYYPAIETHVGTGIYTVFNKERPEGTTT